MCLKMFKKVTIIHRKIRNFAGQNHTKLTRKAPSINTINNLPQELGILTAKTSKFYQNIAVRKSDLKPHDSPVRGRIKEGIVTAMKARFDELVEIETEETIGKSKRLKQSCLKPIATSGSGKKSYRRNVRKSVSDSGQKKILDFYRGLKAREKDAGAA